MANVNHVGYTNEISTFHKQQFINRASPTVITEACNVVWASSEIKSKDGQEIRCLLIRKLNTLFTRASHSLFNHLPYLKLGFRPVLLFSNSITSFMYTVYLIIN
jgi:hypothetical protein